MAEFVQYAVADAVARVTIERPELHNAFNEVVIDEVTAAFERAAGDDSVRAVVMASEGKSFSAGADLHWMKRMVDYSFEENVADATTMAKMLQTIHDCPKPVIARVHGAAYGGGVGLIAASDMAIALDSAVFCLSEVKLGIIPAVISPYVIEKIGTTHSRRYGVTAERFDATEAKRIALVSDTADTVEAMDAKIADICKAIKSAGPLAVAASKAVLRDVQGFMWDKLTELTTQRIAKRRISDEGQEGMKAFLEKRKPNWVSS